MGVGRNCVIITFPYLGTLAALILSLLAVLGQIRTNVLPGSYFLRVNLSNLTTAGTVNLISSGNSNIDKSVVTIVDQIINSNNPLPPFYDTALWNYCYGNYTHSTKDSKNFLMHASGAELTYCSDPRAMYWFNASEILQSTIQDSKISDSAKTVLSQAITAATNIDEVRNYMGTMEAVSKASFVCYIISLCLLALTLIFGLFTFRSRGFTCCTALLSFLSLAFTVVSAGLVTGMYIVIRNLINQHLSSYGITANISSQTMGFVWGAAVAALWGTVWWIITICCGSTGRKEVPEEKQPFIPAYDPSLHYSQHH